MRNPTTNYTFAVVKNSVKKHRALGGSLTGITFGMRRGFCGTVAFKPRPWLSLGGEWGEVTQMVLMWETAWHTRVTGTGVT